MKTFLALILCLNAAWSTCTKINMPTDFASVASGTRANLKANFTEIQTRTNGCMDSVDEVRARITGYAGDFRITSLENLRLRLDGDGSATAKFLVETSNGDSLFRVSEDSTAKFFGSLSIAGASAHTGAATFSSTVSTGALSATTGAFSGILSPAAALTFTGVGSGADWSLWRSAGVGLSIRGGAGSSYDFALFNPAAQYLMRNPTGTQGLEFPGTGAYSFTGKIVGADSLRIAGATEIGSNSFWSGSGQGIWFNTPGTFTYGMYKTGTSLAFRSGSPSPWLTVDASGLPTFATAATFSSTLGVTGKLTGSDTVAAVLGFRAGNTAASNTILYRSGADMWTTPDSLTVAGKVIVTDSILGAAARFSGRVTADTLVSLKFHGDTTFTGTCTGGTGTTTGTVRATRNGNTIIMQIPGFSVTSNANTFTMTGIPAGWRPARTILVTVPGAQDNSGNGTVIYASIGTSGTIDFQWNGSSSGWTASGVKGIIFPAMIVYNRL